MMGNPKPTNAHKKLKHLAGTWKVVCRFDATQNVFPMHGFDTRETSAQSSRQLAKGRATPWVIARLVLCSFILLPPRLFAQAERLTGIWEGDIFMVLGRGNVTIFDGHDHSGKPFFVLTAGARYDLRKREVL